jgi:hypothetical protein
MRTTVRIDDDLLRRLRRQAQREKISLTRILNRVIRRGMASAAAKLRYREKTFDMGQPLVNLDTALALVAQWDDEQTLQKTLAGK